ncbi:Mov34/MPN/PAD-1 family protein [Halopseudomonas xiamenensis]|uniref:Mov34/MPN/PAD-1 family protein n=1 Tax=Halopseudomonas xiamenensis TaxID=157792 RepID=UPI0016289D27|nr:Mov34/MPN/PAD-1 family protein [Halopseudomonas xiamenensis]
MRVEITDDVRSKLRSALRGAGRREIGGVLMGEQIEPGHFRIVDLSIDKEIGGRAHFVRSPEAHAVALDAFFRRTGNEYQRFNYLGEWHSHPRFPVVPSVQDVSSMVELVHGERGIDFAVLLIVRLHWWRTIASSCTLFRRNAKPSSVEILET